MPEVTKWPLKPFLAVIIALQVIVLGLVLSSVTIGFDIPGLRQLSAFLYLTFVPGLLIVRLLKLHKPNSIDTLLYSVGLSLAFEMFLGFSMNMLYPLIGIDRPITALSLVITLAVFVTAMMILLFLLERNSAQAGQKLRMPSLSLLYSPPALFLYLLPLLAVLGTYLVNGYNQNILLLILLGLISLTIGLVAFNRFIPQKLFPFAILMIAVALLWHRSLISQYLIGDDIHTEYILQNLTLTNGHWDMMASRSNVNAMLSITMLGPFYSLLLNLNIIWVDKIIHPLLFALVPLTLFQVYRKQTSNRIAFLAVMLFMSFAAFFAAMPELVRQQVAELFFALSIMLFLDKEIGFVKKSGLLIIFGFSIVVSHYGLSYLYMFYLIVSLGLLLLARTSAVSKLWHRYDGKGDESGKNARATPAIATMSPIIDLSPNFVMLMLVFGLGWYIFVSTGSATFETILNFGYNVFANLKDMFVEQSREPVILMAIGQASPEITSLPRQVFLIIQYITQFFIVIGVATLSFNLRKTRFQPIFIALTMVSALLLLMCITVPYFTEFMTVSRVYHITLFLLAPFCVLGGITVFRKFLQLLPNKRLSAPKSAIYSKLVTLLVLLPYFLFYTGFIYAITGDKQSSFALATANFENIITQRKDITALKWLRGLDPLAKVKGDDHTMHMMASYAGFPGNQRLSFRSQNLDTNDIPFIFLSSGDIAKDEILVLYPSGWGEIPRPVSLQNGTLFEDGDRIYDNGAVIHAARQSQGDNP